MGSSDWLMVSGSVANNTLIFSDFHVGGVDPDSRLGREASRSGRGSSTDGRLKRGTLCARWSECLEWPVGTTVNCLCLNPGERRRLI